MIKPDWTKAPKEPKPKPIHWDTRNEHFCDVDGWWDKAGEYHAIIWGHWGTDRYIPRPVAPAPAPTEWVDGWPTIGEECIFNRGEGKDYVVTPVAHHDGSVVFATQNCYPKYDGCSDLECFRPLPTPEQLKRQSVIDKALSELSEFSDSSQVLGELYDAGMLRDHPGQPGVFSPCWVSCTMQGCCE